MGQLFAPSDLLQGVVDFGDLNTPECDPFVDEEALSEVYLFEVMFDLIDSKLAMLFGIWTALCPTKIGNVGLMIYSSVSEFGWKAEQHDIPPPPHWWVVLSSGLADPNGGARVEIPSLIGWSPRFGSSSEPRYRYSFKLEPNSEAIVTFKSASYFVGTVQLDEEELRATFKTEAEWHAISHWPR